MQNDKIIAAIAAYLDAKTEFRVDFVEGKKTEQVYFRGGQCSVSFLQNIAAEITAAIMPLVSGVEQPDWKDAPEWAQYRTVDKNGQVVFWEKQPQPHLLSRYWVDDAGGNRKYCEVDNWQYKIQQRPK